MTSSLPLTLTWHKTGPFLPPVSRQGTSRWLGYERKVGKRLAQEAITHGFTIRDHEWMKLAPAEGQEERGQEEKMPIFSPISPLWYQPDYVLGNEERVILVEVKLTYKETAFEQLGRYARVMRIYGGEKRPIIQVLVCRNLIPCSPAPVNEFSALFPSCTWHLYL